MIDSGLGIGLTYRLYVKVETGGQVNAVFGNDEAPLSILTTTFFYQNDFGGATSAEINPALFEQFPSLEFDSWVTIGSEDQVGNNMLNIGIDWSDFEDNGGDISTDNGTWFATPDDAQCDEVNGRVLVGQFTTTGDISGFINLQGKCANNDTWQVRNVDISVDQGFAPPLGFATILDEGDGVSRMQRCQEILIDLFDMNYGQVYCNDLVTISSLDFISGNIPASYPSAVDYSGKISNIQIADREDLSKAVEVARTMPSSIDVDIDNFFYNLNCNNLDSKVKEWMSPYRPYRSMVFMITSNDDRFVTEGADVSYVDSAYVTEIIQSLRGNSILHGNGSIHIVDLVPRDIESPVRLGLTRIADMSGGNYTFLRGDQ